MIGIDSDVSSDNIRHCEHNVKTMCENKEKITCFSIIYAENDMIIEEGGDSALALVRKARWLGEQVTMSKELNNDEMLLICREAVEIALKAVENDPSYSTAHQVVAITEWRVTEFAGTSEKIQMSKEIKTGAKCSRIYLVHFIPLLAHSPIWMSPHGDEPAVCSMHRLCRHSHRFANLGPQPPFPAAFYCLGFRVP
jgi:hypothetical protein